MSFNVVSSSEVLLQLLVSIADNPISNNGKIKIPEFFFMFDDSNTIHFLIKILFILFILSEYFY